MPVDDHSHTISLTTPTQAHEMEVVRDIFREYAGTLDLDLSFQSFEEELNTLPGEYAERFCWPTSTAASQAAAHSGHWTAWTTRMPPK